MLSKRKRKEDLFETEVEEKVKKEGLVNDYILIELLKTEEPNSQHRIYSEAACVEFLNNMLYNKRIPMAIYNHRTSSKDIYFIPKSDIIYDKSIKVLKVKIPKKVVQLAPGYSAVPAVEIEHFIYVKDSSGKDKDMKIQKFNIQEVRLIPEDISTFEGLNTKLV